MKKESVKKFDLEAAFKALDEIEIPQTKGIKANRVDLKERFGHKSATEILVEDYYDVSSAEDLKDAKEERDGEIAKAKLARIEKIVDLNAESPEELLPSYVGKVIMQCPQCMTLFYKNPEDIEPSEENPEIVNLNEPCQHCGNTSGYTLIGKVGAVTEDEADKYEEAPTEENENELNLDFGKGTEEVDAEGTGEGAKEMSDEETKEEYSDEASSDDDLDLDLNLDEVPEEEPEEEKKEESLNLSKEASENESEHKSESLTLNEEIDKDLDEKLKAHNDYIAYLQQMIKQEEEALKKAENDEIKAAIQRRLDAFTADLEAALPDAVKAEVSVEDIAEEPGEEAAEEKAEEEAPVDEALTEETKECKVVLADKPEKEVFTGTKEECEKIIEKNKETKTAKKHGLKIVEPAADENEAEEKSALKESVESEIDSIIASWGVNENLIKEDKSLPLRSIEVKDKENSRKGIGWQVIYGGKYNLHKEFKNEEEAKKFAKENNGELMPIRTAEIKESAADKSLPLRSVEVKDKENSRKGIGWQVIYGGKYNLHKEFKNEEEAKKFAKENNGELMPIRTAEIKESAADKSLPLRSIEVKDKENSRKGIGWQVIYGGKYNLHKEFKNEEEAKKFAKENNGELMPIRTAEIKESAADKSLPLRSIEVKDKENSRKGIGWQVIYGGKYNLHKEFKNEEEAKKFAKENNGELMPIRTAEIKESAADKSLPLRSIEVKDKENSRKGIGWQVIYGGKYNLHKEFKNEEEAKKFAKENNGELMPIRTAEIKESAADKSLPLRSIEVKDKENSRKGIGWQVIYGGKYNLHKEFKNEEEAKKFAKENNGELMPIRTAEVGSLKEYWWEDNDPMNWSDKEPLVYSCYYNSELLGYLEYPYMGHEEYPTTIKADIIKHFKLPEGYNPKEISWRYIEKEPIDETKPLIQINESLTEEGDLDRLLDSDEFKTPVSEEEIDAARREVAKESLKEEKEDESMAPTIYRLFLDDKLVYESESIPLNKALSEITAYIKKLTPDQKKSFSLGWEFDESEHDGYCNIPIYDNEGNIVGSRTEWTKTDGDIVVDVFSEAECKEYGYAFPEERLVVNVDYAGDAIRKALDDEEPEEEIEDPEFNEDDVDELDECSLNKHIDEYLKEVYSNVKSYKTTDCELKDGKLIVEGKISFNSGKEKLTMFEFLPAYRKGKLFFEGYNKDFSEDKAFTLNCSINKSKTLITESFGYKYKINKNLVKGLK